MAELEQSFKGSSGESSRKIQKAGTSPGRFAVEYWWEAIRTVKKRNEPRTGEAGCSRSELPDHAAVLH
jgi:hypothetical protein